MSANSSIEWTDTTWNPLTGCTKVSPGCERCYAKTMHERFHGAGSFDTIILHPARLAQPLGWRAPRRVFVNSMSDLFHKDVPADYIARVFAVMAASPRHTFQVLTKRHGRMKSLLSDQFFRAAVRARMPAGTRPAAEALVWPLPNVWVGVSVEDQKWADIRIPALLDTPAAVRWISAEPMLGPITLREQEWIHEPDCLTRDDCMCWPNYSDHLDWVVVGGESGPGARPMHPDWARSLRDQCFASGVAFLFKQWGNWAPNGYLGVASRPQPGYAYVGPRRGVNGELEQIQRMSKKAAGRLLDGRTHDDYPARPWLLANPEGDIRC